MQSGVAVTSDIQKFGIARCKPAQNSRIKLVFGLKHAGGQCFGRVALHHGDMRLPQQRAVIQRRRDAVHGAAMFPIPGRQRAGMGVQTLCISARARDGY